MFCESARRVALTVGSSVGIRVDHGDVVWEFESPTLLRELKFAREKMMRIGRTGIAPASKAVAVGKPAWGFESLILSQIVVIVAEWFRRRVVAPATVGSSPPDHPTEDVRQDEERALKARSGVEAVVGSSPTSSSEVSVAERQGTRLQPGARRFESAPRLHGRLAEWHRVGLLTRSRPKGRGGSNPSPSARWVDRLNGKLSGSKPEAPGSSPGPPAGATVAQRKRHGRW